MEPPSTSLTQRSLSQVFAITEKIKAAIWDRRPILADIMAKHADQSLFEYAKDFMDVNPLPCVDFRKCELISNVEHVARSIFGDKEAAGIGRQLRKLALVSTADHHSPVMHPFFVNSNIVTAIPMTEYADPDLQYVIVFSFAGVSNNNLVFPRGIVFHGGLHGEGDLIRLPLLPDKLKMSAVHSTRALTAEDVERALALLRRRIGCDITEEKAQGVVKVMQEIFLSDDVLKLKDYSSQISLINYRLWPKFFHQKATTSTRSRQFPQLVYLDIEEIVTHNLLEFHLQPRQESLIKKALVDPLYIKPILEHFEGISGAFSAANNWGTHFFWGVDEKCRRVRLFYREGELCSKDGSIVILLNADSIAEALRAKCIFPSMALCYLVVSLYYGMKCLGGFSQVHDLTLLKLAWQKVLRETGESKEADGIDDLQTKELGGDGMVLAFFRNGHGELVPATGLDMMEQDVDTRLEHFLDLSKEVTLDEAMTPLLPEIYSVLYSQEQRDPSLMLSYGAIMEQSALRRKIEKFFPDVQ